MLNRKQNHFKQNNPNQIIPEHNSYDGYSLCANPLQRNEKCFAIKIGARYNTRPFYQIRQNFALWNCQTPAKKNFALSATT